MIPRLKLQQCFMCKNNIPCWGLDKDLPMGTDSREFSIKSQALNALVVNYVGDQELFISEQFGMISAAFLQTLKSDNVFDKSSLKRDIYQLICVLCAFCNTPDDTWTCPGEDQNDESTFIFEPK